MRRDIYTTAEAEERSMKYQLMRCIQYLEHLPVQIFCIDNIEADDAIAYITSNFYDKTANKIRIVSSDRDFLQLLSDRVEVYSPVKKKLYTPQVLQDELELHPHNYLIYRVITGDTSDNIEGVKGIGLKTLLKTFPELKQEKYDLEYLYDQSISEVKPKAIHKNLIENKHITDRNYDLMQLHDVEISAHTKLQIGDAIQGSVNKTNRYELKKMIIEDGLQNDFKNIDGWLTNTFNSLAVW